MANLIALPTDASLLDQSAVYRQAQLAVTPDLLREWLRGQPLKRVVGHARSATGGVLGTYLVWMTPYVWCVSPSGFWRLHDPETCKQPLPTWASAFVRGEDRIGDPITVNDALNLLDRLGVI